MNFTAVPDEQLGTVIQAYVTGMMDEKESIIELISELKDASEDLTEQALYANLIALINEGDLSGP